MIEELHILLEYPDWYVSTIALHQSTKNTTAPIATRGRYRKKKVQ